MRGDGGRDGWQDWFVLLFALAVLTGLAAAITQYLRIAEAAGVFATAAVAACAAKYFWAD